MYQKVIIACVMVVSALFLVPNVAQACSCHGVIYPKMSQKKLVRLKVNLALHQSEAVFSGEVIQITPRETADWEKEVQVRFKVAESWKGKLQEEAAVFTSIGCCGCGYSFEVGDVYLVYAYRVSERLVTSFCTRTAKLVDAKKDLMVLGKGKAVGSQGLAFFSWAKHNKALQLTAR